MTVGFAKRAVAASRLVAARGSEPHFRPRGKPSTPTQLAYGRQQLGAAMDVRIADPRRFAASAHTYCHFGPYMPTLLYAAAEDELASEYEHGALSYGAFTYALVEHLNRKREEPLRFGQLMAQVRSSLRRRKFTQTPQLQGPRKALEWTVPWSAAGRR